MILPLLTWLTALAGPYDTTELVVLGQPTAMVLTWRPDQVLGDDVALVAADCMVSVTAQDEGKATFNTAGCASEQRPLVDRALQSANGKPVEELGWGLKAWATVQVSLTPAGDILAVTLAPVGTEGVPELGRAHITTRETPQPIYPPDEKWRGITGTCDVHLRVDTKGRPEHVEALRCTDGFADASVEALQQWRFKPHRVDGTPVVFDTVVRMVYTLSPELPKPSEASP